MFVNARRTVTIRGRESVKHGQTCFDCSVAGKLISTLQEKLLHFTITANCILFYCIVAMSGQTCFACRTVTIRGHASVNLTWTNMTVLLCI